MIILDDMCCDTCTMSHILRQYEIDTPPILH